MFFAHSAFGQFMASALGRSLRVIAGLALMALGFWIGVDDVWGIVLIAIGAVPLLAGSFDVCVLSALFGGPFSGARIRAVRP